MKTPGRRRSLADRLLDASVFFSFDASGFRRHAQHFDPGDTDVDLSGRRVLITGGNSGLGKAAAHALGALGAEVWLLCRNAERGAAALRDLREATGSDAHRLEIVDLSLGRSVRSFAERLQDLPVHALVHNAGVLPARRQLTEEGLELTWATNVVGPFLLTGLLLPNLRAAGQARVINVSSGGMYPQRLDLSDLDWRSRTFDGVAAYANSKRAEVALTQLWSRRLHGTGIDVNAMHPGWADTPGVRDSLPRFWRLTRGRLRTPREGADTIVWLVATDRLRGSTGHLYFDRRKVDTHLFPWTRERSGDEDRLWRLCCEESGWGGSPPRPQADPSQAGSVGC